MRTLIILIVSFAVNALIHWCFPGLSVLQYIALGSLLTVSLVLHMEHFK